MKIVISLLLILPMVLSDLSAPVVIKIIFSKDTVITESFDFRGIAYEYIDGTLSFKVKHNSTGHYGKKLVIKGDFQNLEFVVENLFANKSDGKGVFCYHDSSEELLKLIDSCSGDTRIRTLTYGERKLLEKLQKEQKETGSPLKVVYDQRLMQTSSVGLDQLELINLIEPHDFGWNRLYINATDNQSNSKIMWLPKHFIDKSFVVDAFPENSGINCNKTTLTDLKPDQCEGDIQLREFKVEDKYWFRIRD